MGRLNFYPLKGKKEMEKLFVTFLIALLFYSCGSEQKEVQQTGETFVLTKIGSYIADTNATVCISSGEMRLYTDFKSELSPFEELTTGRYVHFFRLVGNDSIVPETSGDSISADVFRGEISILPFACYDSLSSFHFLYDSLTVLPEAMGSGEILEHFVESDSMRVASVFNTKTWTTRMMVSWKGANTAIQICDARETADFFLCDFTSDKQPEICVVTRFPMPSTTMGEVTMIRLDIYRIQFK